MIDLAEADFSTVHGGEAVIQVAEVEGKAIGFAGDFAFEGGFGFTRALVGALNGAGARFWIKGKVNVENTLACEQAGGADGFLDFGARKNRFGFEIGWDEGLVVWKRTFD